MLIVGRVQKPHGIKGSVKAASFMDSPYELAKLKTVWIEKIEYCIEDIKISSNTIIIKFKDIDSIEDAQKLKNKTMSILREQAPQPQEGRYYVNDIIGCEVFIGDKLVGKVIDIMLYGSADVYQVKGDKSFMFAYAGDVVEKIDIKGKKIFLNADELEKVAVYED